MPELSAAGDGPAGRHRAATRQQHAADRTLAPAHALLQARVPAPPWLWGWGSALELGRGVCRRVLHQGSSLHGISLGSGVGVGEPQVLLSSSEMLVEGTWPYREPTLGGGDRVCPCHQALLWGPAQPSAAPKIEETWRAAPMSPSGWSHPSPGCTQPSPRWGQSPPNPFIARGGRPSSPCALIPAAQAQLPERLPPFPGYFHQEFVTAASPPSPVSARSPAPGLSPSSFCVITRSPPAWGRMGTGTRAGLCSPPHHASL